MVLFSGSTSGPNRAEKDKALWAGKFDFLEKQKEQYKKDNEDQQALFQQTVD